MKIYYIKNTSDRMIFLVGGHLFSTGILTSIVHISYPHRKKIHSKIRTNFISSTGPQKNISIKRNFPGNHRIRTYSAKDLKIQSMVHL